MSLYDRYILAPMIDRMCGTREVMDIRREVVPLAEGDVIELGIGSGLNLACYDPDRVRRVVGVDPGENITALARERIACCPFEVEMVGLSGESVPQPSSSFDTAVVTFTFCTIPDVYRAVSEVRRLLKPGGRLLFAEHGLAPDPKVARWQSRINPLWKRLAGGCHLNRDTQRILEDGGFRIDDVRAGHAMPGPSIATWVTRGVAVPR
ncbi:MAG: class I SAM-dependent methyltransferase [Gammaproteobacteria bacterium]|nr:MAG: class I SAM-dependent methyltransferase [Gammaproteobacteria bacterium]